MVSSIGILIKSLSSICSARDGNPKFEQGICSVNIGRNLHLTIQGVSKSALPAGITFESLDAQGNALNLAEVVVLLEELSQFIYALAKNGLIVSTIHNHWIFTNPTILYVHIQSVLSRHFLLRENLQKLLVY